MARDRFSWRERGRQRQIFLKDEGMTRGRFFWRERGRQEAGFLQRSWWGFGRSNLVCHAIGRLAAVDWFVQPHQDFVQPRPTLQLTTSHYSLTKTVSSFSYPGAQQQRNRSTPTPVLVIWCGAPGGMAMASPGPTVSDSQPIRIWPAPSKM